MNALNRAYDVQETRPFWKVRGIAILMTLGLSALILIGVLLLVAGPSIGRTSPRYLPSAMSSCSSGTSCAGRRRSCSWSSR